MTTTDLASLTLSDAAAATGHERDLARHSSGHLALRRVNCQPGLRASSSSQDR